MNNIFLKNLEALSRKNVLLAQKLQTYVPSELPKLVQENGAYNISYKNGFVHNEKNPLAEANEIFAMAENTPVSIHIVYGLGLGYLFQLTSLKSVGSVILYEPDLNILWLAFTLVDFSNDILKQNVEIASTVDEVNNFVYKKSGTKNTPVLLSLPSQRKYDTEKFDEFVANLKNTVGAFSLDLKYTQQKFYPSLKMLIQNIPNLLKEIPLHYFKDIYAGKTAVVVSAGPTLDKNIEVLKKYRENYVLFTVGTAVKTLYAHGIKPDFLCIIETYNSSRQVEGLDLSDVNLITEPYANPALRNFKYKNIYSHISNNNPINLFWSEICEENAEDYLSKGTVSYTALNSARLLGCSKIILVGQDLAYIEGQCYSKDSAYKDLSCEYNQESQRWEITAKDFEQFAMAICPSSDSATREAVAKSRLNNLNASLHYVKGINGDKIPTESVYATFIEPLQEFARVYSDRKYINTSMVGAQIDGFENMYLEEALKDSSVAGDLDLKLDFSYNKERIVQNLRSGIEEMKKVASLIVEGKNLVRNLNNNVKRYRAANTEVLQILKKLTLNYQTISEDFANKSKILDFIIKSDKIDIDYEMKMMREFNVDSVVKLNKNIQLFYEHAEVRMAEIERLINESINTAG